MSTISILFISLLSFYSLNWTTFLSMLNPMTKVILLLFKTLKLFFTCFSQPLQCYVICWLSKQMNPLLHWHLIWTIKENSPMWVFGSGYYSPCCLLFLCLLEQNPARCRTHGNCFLMFWISLSPSRSLCMKIFQRSSSVLKEKFQCAYCDDAYFLAYEIEIYFYHCALFFFW